MVSEFWTIIVGNRNDLNILAIEEDIKFKYYTYLSIILHNPEQVYAMDDGGLVKLACYAEVFLQFLLADRVQHSSVHQVRQERLRILRIYFQHKNFSLADFLST